MDFQTRQLEGSYDYLAPDGSEIRLLSELERGGLCHCTLPSGKTSQAVRHKTVEEIWFFIEGQGQVWRKQNEDEEVTDVSPGICLTVPSGMHFQFRNTGDKNLSFIISTMPAWPGENEAERVKDHWND